MSERWREAVACEFRDLAARLPMTARAAPVTLCSMSACIDARLDMARIEPLLRVDSPRGRRPRVAPCRTRKPRRRRRSPGRVARRAALAHRAARHSLRPRQRRPPGRMGADDARRTGAGVPRGSQRPHAEARAPGNAGRRRRAVRAGSLAASGERRPDIFIFEYMAGVRSAMSYPRVHRASLYVSMIRASSMTASSSGLAAVLPARPALASSPASTPFRSNSWRRRLGASSGSRAAGELQGSPPSTWR